MNCASARCSRATRAASAPRSARRRCGRRPRNPAARAPRRASTWSRGLKSKLRAARPSGAPRRWRSRRGPPAPTRAAGSADPAASARAPPARRRAALGARELAARAPRLRAAAARCPRRGPCACADRLGVAVALRAQAVGLDLPVPALLLERRQALTSSAIAAARQLRATSSGSVRSSFGSIMISLCRSGLVSRLRAARVASASPIADLEAARRRIDNSAGPACSSGR